MNTELIQRIKAADPFRYKTEITTIDTAHSKNCMRSMA